MEKSEEYIKHAAGIYDLLIWTKNQESLGAKCKYLNDTIFVPKILSRYFTLSVNPKNKLPILGVQKSEATWIKLISWENISIRDKDSTLYLISKTIPGDNEQYPDILPFAIALELDSENILNLLKSLKHIEARNLSLYNKKPHINLHSKLFKIPIRTLKYQESYLNEKTYSAIDDLRKIKEKKQQDHYEVIPEFIGDPNEAQSILGSFWAKQKKFWDNAPKD